MLDKIIHFSIKNKLVIGILVIALIGWGIASLRQLPIDAVPDITNNQVQIITNSPSNGAEDIERFITFPIEQTMATIQGIDEIRSFSRFGLSVVTVVFEEDIDVYWARQQVAERLSQATGEIPPGMGVPNMAPITTGLGEIYQYVIHPVKGYEDRYDATELRTIQDWIVRRQLLGVEGVADVSSFGGYLKQYEIAINPEELRSMNISISEVFTALEKNNQNTGGAYIDKKPNTWFIRSEGMVNSIHDIENIPVKNTASGIPILIRDVAKVKIGSAIRYGAMTRNNEGEVVGAVVMMLKGANSSKAIANVKERMAQIEKTLPEGLVVEPFLDRTKLVDNSISTVVKNLTEGALIVIFVLILLLGNFRAGLIVASVIPLSMLFAISMMNLFGVSGNLMSLGAIDFGLIVDGAVIIVEATLHHLSLRKVTTKLTQDEMDSEVRSSASKIMGSAAFGEIIILIVYLPILVLVGVEGKMFRPMAQTVSFAILGAFLLSLTYVPMISALVLSKKTKHKKTISDRLIAFFQRIYSVALNFTLRAKILVVSTAAALLLISVLVFNQMGAEFIPTLEEGDFAVETRVMTGSSLSHTVEVAQNSAKILLDNFPEVIDVIGKIGSSEIPTDPMPMEACDLIVMLKDKSEWTSAHSREGLAEKMQQKLEQYMPGVTYGFQQPIQMRFNELMTGARQDVVIKIYGEDLDKLSTYAKKIGNIARKIDGAEDVYVEEVSGLPQMVVHYKRDEMARFGLNIEDVNTTIRMAFAGISSGQVFEGEKRFDLVVRLDKQNRQNLEDLRHLYITAPGGQQIPLEQLADVDFEDGPNQIQRDDAQRRITVGFNVRGRDVESIVEEIQDKVDREVQFEPGYYPTYGGTFENLQEAKTRLSIALPVALLLIFVLLYFTFSSIKQALLIFTAIPLSSIGGIMALYFRGMPFSISAGVGFIALFGVAVLNGIVLIAEFNSLKKSGLTDLDQIVKQGTATRLRPVIMTALVASLGFLPMAISNGNGAEVQRPLATVVIGGLITATMLTLLVLPVLYMWFEKIKGKKVFSSTVTVVALMLMIPLSSQAQVDNLSLQQAIDMGLANNKSVNSSRLMINYQQQQKKAGFELPKTDISLLYGQYNSNIKYDNNISLTQSIPFPTVFSANAALGNSRIHSSELQLDVSENQLAYQIKSTYNYLQYLYERELLLQKQDSIFSEFLNAATVRYNVGESNLLGKTSAEVQYQEVRNSLRQNEGSINAYLSQLQALLASDVQPSIADSALTERPFSLPDDTSAISSNPGLAYALQQIEVAEKEKKLALASNLPDISLGYFNQSLIGPQTINGQDVYFNVGQRFQGFQVGVSIPLFYGAYNAKVKAADVNAQIVQSDYEFHEDQLQGHYQTAAINYVKEKNNLEYYKNAALPNAKVLLNNTHKAYLQGEIDYPEYLLNLKQVYRIYEAYLQALEHYNQSIINLEFLTGKI